MLDWAKVKICINKGSLKIFVSILSINYRLTILRKSAFLICANLRETINQNIAVKNYLLIKLSRNPATLKFSIR